MNRIAPGPRGSMRRAACWPTRKPPKALTAIARAPPPGRVRRSARGRGRWRCRPRRRAARVAIDRGEQRADLLGLRRVAGEGRCAGLGASAASLSGLRAASATCRPFLREQPRQRGAQPAAGADDQGRSQIHGQLLRSHYPRDAGAHIMGWLRMLVKAVTRDIAERLNPSPAV